MGRRSIVVSCLLLCACTTARSAPPEDAALEDHDLVLIPDTAPAHDSAMVTCDTGLIDCNGTCSRVAADALNCGSCGNVCPPHVGCANGRCDCGEPKLSCDGLCIDPTMDHDNCGSCGHACGVTEMCSMGMCIVQCTDPGHGICVETNPSTGMRTQTCVDLQTDAMHCGMCNTHCGGAATCVAGVCTCTSGTSCMGSCVDLQTDAMHCGTCYTGCGASGVCTAGTCSMCGTGLTSCGSPAHCVDVMTNPLDCGSCGNTCPLGASCVAGVCTCAGGGTACGTGCIDTTSSDANCGTCGHACQAMSTCMASACVCASPLTDCGGVCVDPMSDIGNCGGCGHGCGVGGVCNSGVCMCGPGYTMCDAVSCTNTQYDRDNCGSCGFTCPAGEVCLMGGCTNAPPTHYIDSIPSATEAPFVDACAAAGHTVVLATTDDSSNLVALPFPFRYWATDLTAGAMVNVCSNGWLGMDGMSNNSLGGSIPSTSVPNAVIAPHWGDLYTSAAGICIATVGAAPNRQWVVEFSGTEYFSDRSAMLTFEVVLSESSGTIDFIYQTMTGGHAYTTGLEDPTGTMGIGGCGATMYSCNPTAGTRVRFSPIP